MRPCVPVPPSSLFLLPSLSSPSPFSFRFCKRGQTVTLPYTGRIRSGRLGSNLEEDERKGREEERHWSEVVEQAREEKRKEEEMKRLAQQKMGEVVVSGEKPFHERNPKSSVLATNS